MPKFAQYRHLLPEPRQLGRFLVVGLLGTGIDIVLFALLRAWFGLPVLVANVLAYSVGIVNNYLLHRRWTYRGVAGQANATQIAQFTTVSLVALAINTALVVLLSAPFGRVAGSAVLGDLLAKACATAAGIGINFCANHFWTFRPSLKVSPAHEYDIT